MFSHFQEEFAELVLIKTERDDEMKPFVSAAPHDQLLLEMPFLMST